MSYNNDGILLINKEENMTSYDVIRSLKKITHINKIGHAGTLDPNATGMLPVFIGKATKLNNYISDFSKEYICKGELGKTSDTLDIWGEVKSVEIPDSVNDKSFLNVIKNMQGEFYQKTPMYSARKINGKKLYEYARKNIDINPPSKLVCINNLEVLELDIPFFEIKVDCSKGTYIRAICRDIGLKLNTSAVMTSLIRTRFGRFNINESVKISELNDESQIRSNLITIEDYFKEHEKIIISDKANNLLYNGNKIDIKFVINNINLNSDKLYRIYDYNNRFMGMYKYSYENLIPDLFIG